MNTKQLLQLRKKLNAKRPHFSQCDSYKRKEISKAWRRPKGMHNKMRHGVHGKPVLVNVGYRNPAEVRGMDNNGMMPITVYNTAQVAALDVKKNSVILGNIGNKKKAAVLAVCKQKGFTVLNVKKIDDAINAIQSAVKQRKDMKAATKKTAAPVKPAKKEEKTTTAQDDKKQDKEQMQKIVTQRSE